MDSTEDLEVHERVAALLQSAGIRDAPVDVWRIANALGIHVQMRPDLPASVCGFLYAGPRYPVVVVNGNQPQTRRRFTMAHELWHALTGEGALRLSAAADADGDVALEERLANRFASALLVPQDWLLQDLARGGGSPKRDYLARRYGVSRTCMGVRLRSLER